MCLESDDAGRQAEMRRLEEMDGERINEERSRE